MKVTTIALATAFTLTNTFALARANGTAGVRISRAAFSGFVCGSGGFDKCSPDVEEHWPSSASAQRSYCRSLFREHLCAEPCTVQGSQVKEKPRICAGLFLTHSSWEM